MSVLLFGRLQLCANFGDNFRKQLASSWAAPPQEHGAAAGGASKVDCATSALYTTSTGRGRLSQVDDNSDLQLDDALTWQPAAAFRQINHRAVDSAAAKQLQVLPEAVGRRANVGPSGAQLCARAN